MLRWYARHARALPWRGASPYAVWVSEVMLQQTRVEAVIPYFERWMARFPSLPDLAAASEQEVLSLWEGLGYYSRARHLRRAAKIILERFGGELPRQVEALRKIPGIGRYTAAAIASIAFGADEVALDGNLRRVLARLFDVSIPADTAAGERALRSLAEEHLPRGRAGDFNQAMMDLGASVCLPKDPRCFLCPLADLCRARALGVQGQRPVMKPRTETPRHVVTAAVIRRDGAILLAQRLPGDLLGGMWEFPGGKARPGEGLAECLRREIREELGVRVAVREPFGVYHHAYTHFRITLHAFWCDLISGEPRPLQAAAVAWVSPDRLADYPMGKVDRQIARKILAMGIK